jgi:DNA-binding CsgD family transcriptional regulator
VPRWSPESASLPHADAAPRATLTGGELVALQLLAAGYTPDQIAALHGVPAVAVLNDLAGALAALGVPNVRAAVSIARDRGLIV